MNGKKKVEVGSVVFTVGPTGKPNGNTARIGYGRVVELWEAEDVVGGEVIQWAGVDWADGKTGSWPVDRLAVRVE